VTLEIGSTLRADLGSHARRPGIDLLLSVRVAGFPTVPKTMSGWLISGVCNSGHPLFS